MVDSKFESSPKKNNLKTHLKPLLIFCLRFFFFFFNFNTNDIGLRAMAESHDSELERLESDVKDMAQKIIDYRATLPDQLSATLRSILDAQRPFLPPEQTISREESSSTPEDPEVAKKVQLLNEKISSNFSAMPIVLNRMKDCIARIEKLDSYNAAIINPAFKRKKTS